MSVKSKECEVCPIMSFVWVPIPSMFNSLFISVRSQESTEETMSPLNHYKISGSKLIDANQEVAKKFEKMGWANFFRCFDGHHVEITKIFTMNFEDDRVQIGGFEFVVNEDKIAEAAKLPQVGEC